jgi:tetratricopeptide (TPR) repeat protein
VLPGFRAFVFVVVAAPGLLAQTVASSPAPAPSSTLLQQAVEDYRTGKFDSAIEKYQAVLQQDANSGEAYAGLARTYLKQEKVELAFETATKGVAQAPASWPAHTALGEVYFRQAKMPESEKEFLAGVNAPHPDARACLGLSRLYEAYSLHARARKMLERAHQLDSGDPEIQRRWARTLRRQEQIDWLEKYLAGPSNDEERTRQAMQSYLELLKERAQQPQQNCRLVGKVTSTEAVLKPMMTDATHFQGFGLMVNINGQSSKLRLDTGATGLVINRRLAEKAGIKQLATNKFGGVGDKGDASGYVGYADSIKVGELEFQHCMVEVSDKRSVLNDDGLIGADVFGHYLVTIDFLWQKLKLEELPHRPGDTVAPITLASRQQDEPEDEAATDNEQKKASSGENKAADADTGASKVQGAAAPGPQDRYIAPEMQNYTRVFRFGHELLIPTQVGSAPSKLFLIDTGSGANFISPQAAREVTKVRGDENMHVKGVSGSVKNVYSADKAIIQFSHFRQENQDMTAFDMSNLSKSTGTEISGILGFDTLHLFVIKIDYRDGLVDFEYAGPKK